MLHLLSWFSALIQSVLLFFINFGKFLAIISLDVSVALFPTPLLELQLQLL